eukprot:14384645-Ditylum_brightwellii.AAC.1
MASTVRNILILMTNKLQEDLNQDIQDMQQRQAIGLNGYLSKLSATVVSNTESLEKIESNLDI